MLYEEFLDEIKSYEDSTYREFHKKLLKNDSVNVIGVRVPVLRKLAKKYAKNIEEIFAFPNEYYEVVFIKLTIVSSLKYDDFLKYLKPCVLLIDNWATCDCFAPKCIAAHRDEFLPLVREYAATNGEFTRRFALTTLLHFYVEEKYLNVLKDVLSSVDTNEYYVHMAAAWLTAEILVKFYDFGVEFLEAETLDKRTHNKAVQKALESYRLTYEQKNFLKGKKR